jgi:putative heme-binding domain-containing protein
MTKNRSSFIPFIATFLLVAAAATRAGFTQETPGQKMKLPEGFASQLIYRVPSDQGSWVSMTYDPQGRLITSDQYGKLYRVTPQTEGEATVEPIDLKIGFAQGLLCAFDSLYVVAHADRDSKLPPGLFRVRDTDGDDQYDSVELLRQFEGGSEHGPHAVILSPDKQSLYICAGNATELPAPEVSRVPLVWQEDQLLTRLPDAGGHAVGRRAPGGWVCKTDPDGKKFELVSMGYRNEYDIAFDPNGELFTYDADMEWDVGLPWYRPTRVCHVTSGSEYGWRHGSGKWPDYYPDNLPGIIDIGPGSPTGIVFGTGAKFPASFQNALFIADWSYGKIYAVHLQAKGSSYLGKAETFCSAPALPVTDLVINPHDGAMYFLIGGRRSRSCLFRISYTGTESTEPAKYPPLDPEVAKRRALEQYHLPGAQPDWKLLWQALQSPDRFLRFAARTALEKQPVESWADQVASQSDSKATLEAVVALARCGQPKHQSIAVKALKQLDWGELDRDSKLALLRAYGLVLIRLGTPRVETVSAVKNLRSYFPSKDDAIDRELAKLLIAVDAPGVTEQIVNLMIGPNAQEQQIAYAIMLLDAKSGWSLESRSKYFQWFLDAAKIQGGNSLTGYVGNIRKTMVERLSDKEKSSLADILSREPETTDPYADLKSRPFVKKWSLEDLLPMTEDELSGRNLENGKKMFAVAACYKCHRISGQGGIVGPDLTPAGHRFSTADLLETIVDPSKSVSDQYEATIFQLVDGTAVVGRVANLNRDFYQVQEDMINPGKFTRIQVDEIDAMKPSKISMMPTGLLDNLTREEILDLVAYLKSTANEETLGTE